jgi:CDP-4-dehydro-6-deoxyglucose reductase, E1
MIRFGCLDFGPEEREAIVDLISPKDPQLTMGKRVYEFERSFAEWLGSKYAVMVNSGTSALLTALQGLKINNRIEGVGNTIQTTALTYCADWNALTLSGLSWAPRDVGDDFVLHLDTYDPALDSYRDFLSVDLLGKPCRLTNLIDDASEAVGSKLQHKKMGTHALCGTFSFYVAHIINTIEGGMVVTDDDELYRSFLSIRDNGRICTCPVCTLKTSGKCFKRTNSVLSIERRWETQTNGYNFKPTEIQGALGLVKMSKIDMICKRRHDIYKRYFEEFHEMAEESDEYIVPLAYPVKVKDPAKALAYMEKQGVECRGMFPAFSKSYHNAYRISQEYILIPAHQELSDNDVEFIISQVKKCQ